MSHDGIFSRFLGIAKKRGNFFAMAFTNYFDIEAALNKCFTVEDWENFTGSVQIPKESGSVSYQKLVELK